MNKVTRITLAAKALAAKNTLFFGCNAEIFLPKVGSATPIKLVARIEKMAANLYWVAPVLLLCSSGLDSHVHCADINKGRKKCRREKVERRFASFPNGVSADSCPLNGP